MKTLSRITRRWWLIVFFQSGSVFAAGASDLIGQWQSFDDHTNELRAIIKIEQQGQKLNGKIDKVLDPDAKPDERCDLCVDDRKGQLMLGLEIIRDVNLMPEGDVFKGGKILDPEEGREYRLTLQLDPKSKELLVRGYWGPFYRTQVWKRLNP